MNWFGRYFRNWTKNTWKTKKDINIVSPIFMTLMIPILIFLIIENQNITFRISFTLLLLGLLVTLLILSLKTFLISISILTIFLLVFWFVKSKPIEHQQELVELRGTILKVEEKFLVLSTKKFGNVLIWKSKINVVLQKSDFVVLEANIKNIDANDFGNFYLVNKINGVLDKIKVIEFKLCKYNLDSAINNFANRQEHFFQKYFMLFLFSKSNDFNDTKETAKSLNILHLIAISGMHFNCLKWAFDHIFFWIKNKKQQAAITNGFLFFYLLLLNNFISGLRAFIMIVFKSFDKKEKMKILDSWVISLFVVFVLNPYYVFSFSTILSFTFSLITLFLGRICKNNIENKVYRFLTFSFLTCLFSLPFSIYLNQKMNLFSLFWIMIYTPIFQGVFLISFFFFFNTPMLNFIYFALDKMLIFSNHISLFINNIYVKKEVVFLYYLALILMLTMSSEILLKNTKKISIRIKNI
ncbi:MAG0480 family ComEC-like protein [Mycoplasmopsis hyopharyngis]|uniref:MAG0480 family ComEC-like protein n=1 Tax=Mycoplasmopsis hyopharyngis TaxID=29558 RepID=UPI003873BCDC